MLKPLSVLLIAIGLIAAPAAAQNASQIKTAKAGKSCAGCNLFQADFSYSENQSMDLSRARLRQANLSLATFDSVNFSGVNLSVANMFGARFTRCDFSAADLSRSTAVGTYFGRSSLTDANLSDTNLSGADLSLSKGLTQSQLDQACGDKSTRLPQGLRIPACR